MNKLFSKLATLACSLVLVSSLTAHAQGPLEGRIVILDPGHGNTSNYYNGYYEGAAMYEFAYILKPMLEAQGATVVLTREVTTNISLVERMTLSNQLSMDVLADSLEQKLLAVSDNEKAEVQATIDEARRLSNVMQTVLDDPSLDDTYYFVPYASSTTREIHPDTAKIFSLQSEDDVRSRMLFISLHSNATGTPINESRNGVSAYYVSQSTLAKSGYIGDFSSTTCSNLFSTLILDNLATLGFERGLVYENVFFVNRETNLPSVLVENGFHTNDDDREKLSYSVFLEMMGKVYVDTIITYYQSDLVPEIPVYTSLDTIEGYTDVYQDLWYTDGVTYAIEQDLIPPTSTDYNYITKENSHTFSPNGMVSVGDLLYGLYQYDGQTYQNKFTPQQYPSPDAPWYYDAVLWAIQNDLIYEVDDLASLDNNLTSNTLALVLSNYLDLVLKGNLPQVNDVEWVNALTKTTISSHAYAHITDLSALYADTDFIAYPTQTLALINRSLIPVLENSAFDTTYQRAQLAVILSQFSQYLAQ